jgi:hypothetical protein
VYDPFLDPIEIQQRNQSAKPIAGAAVDDIFRAIARSIAERVRTFDVDSWVYDPFLDPIEIQQRNQSAKALPAQRSTMSTLF